jgi:hypothetical protein
VPRSAPASRRAAVARRALPALVSVTFRLAPQQRDKLAQLGGEAWLREQTDRAALAPASD